MPARTIARRSYCRCTSQLALDEYRRLTRKLSRFPTAAEFDCQARTTFNTLLRKVGPLAQVRQAMKGPDDDRWDKRWLAQLWRQTRIAAAGKTLQLKDSVRDFDLAYVFEHDWPDCPRKVLSERESEEVRRSHARRAERRPRRQRRLDPVTRDELIAAIRYHERRQPGLRYEEFLARAHVTGRAINLEFRSYDELRRSAGLACGTPDRKFRYSRTELLDAWVDLKLRFGRAPSLRELSSNTPYNHQTYYKRFGNAADIRRHGDAHHRWRTYRQERARELAADPEGPWGAGLLASNHSAAPAGQSPAEIWAGYRVGFELNSRGAKSWSEHPEVLLCVQHDWPAYPGWVVEARELKLS